MSTQRESRPDHEAAVPRTHSGFSVTDSPDNRDDDTPLLSVMSPRGRRIALEYFEAGRAEGWCAGYSAAEEDFAAIHRRAWAIVQDVARRPSYAELAERRGEPERAARQRQLLRDRGVIS